MAVEKFYKKYQIKEEDKKEDGSNYFVFGESLIDMGQLMPFLRDYQNYYEIRLRGLAEDEYLLLDSLLTEVVTDTRVKLVKRQTYWPIQDKFRKYCQENHLFEK